VIASGRGSSPELIDNGVTGMIIDDLDAAADAVSLVGRLDRATIRETTDRQFGRESGATRYDPSTSGSSGPELTRPQLRAVGRFLVRRGIGLTSRLSTSPTVRSRVTASRSGRCS
jgi:hypothetical protein